MDFYFDPSPPLEILLGGPSLSNLLPTWYFLAFFSPLYCLRSWRSLYFSPYVVFVSLLFPVSPLSQIPSFILSSNTVAFYSFLYSISASILFPINSQRLPSLVPFWSFFFSSRNHNVFTFPFSPLLLFPPQSRLLLFLNVSLLYLSGLSWGIFSPPLAVFSFLPYSLASNLAAETFFLNPTLSLFKPDRSFLIESYFSSPPTSNCFLETCRLRHSQYFLFLFSQIFSLPIREISSFWQPIARFSPRLCPVFSLSCKVPSLLFPFLVFPTAPSLACCCFLIMVVSLPYICRVDPFLHLK